MVHLFFRPFQDPVRIQGSLFVDLIFRVPQITKQGNHKTDSRRSTDKQGFIGDYIIMIAVGRIGFLIG